MMGVELEAMKFAIIAHDGVYRKEIKIPYIIHPIQVCETVKEWNEKYQDLFQSYSGNIYAAALLHDTVEDVEHITIDIIEKEFGSDITNLVAGLTKASMGYEKKLNRAERKLMDNLYLRTTSKDVQIIKAADIYCNAKDIYESSNKSWVKLFVNEKIDTINNYLTKLPHDIKIIVLEQLFTVENKLLNV